jgi:glutamyl-tRNA reductase
MNTPTSKLYALSINHKNSTASERSRWQIGSKEIAPALEYLFNKEGVGGVLALMTCNRVEYYFSANESISPIELLSDYYTKFLKIDASETRTVFELFEDKESVEHLFRVISGLESLVFGEFQIVGQVKDAYSLACATKTLDKTLHKLFHAAFRCGKLIRTQTTVGEGKRSVSGAASKIIIDNVDLNSRIALIGVNENTRIMATELTKAGFTNLLFINRTLLKAEMLAAEFGGSALPLTEIELGLSAVSAVFTSTSAQKYLIDSTIIASLNDKGALPRIFVDMAIPSDVESSALPMDASYFNLDGLKSFLDNERLQNMQDLPKAEKMIEDEASIFMAWTEYAGSEIMEPYAEKFETLRLQLLDEHAAELSPNQLKIADRITRSLVHRLQSTFIGIIKSREN